MSGSFGDDSGALPDVMVAGSGPNSAIHSTSIHPRSSSGHNSNSASNAGANTAHSSIANPAHREHFGASCPDRPSISPR
jgi:hypothetical protein